jgi:thiamine-monophosphate kinase
VILAKFMNEKDLITLIKSELSSKYIGDDCAYLKHLGIVVSQDNLVEDVHFSMKYSTAYELGYKSVMVNLSDIAASGGKPECLTVGLSLPKNIGEDFVKEFYSGMKRASCGVEVAGGDITGSEKIFISVTVIGSDKGRKISSRSNAKAGQKVCVSGNHGSSALGLKLLTEENFDKNNKFIKSHLMPNARLDVSEKIAASVGDNYAMMDTSDGLADALFAISSASNVGMMIDFEKIPHAKELENYENWKDLVLFGGEDYELVAVLDEVPEYMTEIGKTTAKCGITIIDGEITKLLNKDEIFAKTYNHF